MRAGAVAIINGYDPEVYLTATGDRLRVLTAMLEAADQIQLERARSMAESIGVSVANALVKAFNRKGK